MYAVEVFSRKGIPSVVYVNVNDTLCTMSDDKSALPPTYWWCQNMVLINSFIHIES